MPFRVIVNGVQIETDTVEEALSLTAHKDGGSSQKARKTTRNEPRPTLADVFDNGYKPALAALLAGPVDTTKLAASIDKVAKSLPPIVRAWRVRTRRAGRNLDEFLRIERSPDGRTAIYTLTEEGRKVFTELNF